MHDISAGPSPWQVDDSFLLFHQRLLVEFSDGFGRWLNAPRHSPSDGPEHQAGCTLGEIMLGGSAVSEQLQRRAAERVDAVYDLARLCRNFVTGELWAWGFLSGRCGATVEDAIRSAADRVSGLLAETRSQRWDVGLRCLPGDYWYSTFQTDKWIEETWGAVVVEGIRSFLEECLRPALIRDEPQRSYERARAQVRSLSREAMGGLQTFLSAETGREISLKNIARVAGYSDTTELERWMRYDRRLTKTGDAKIGKVFLMTPEAFVSALDKLQSAVSKEALSVQKMAKILGQHEDTIHRWIRTGKIKATKIGGKWLIPRSEPKRLRAETNLAR